MLAGKIAADGPTVAVLTGGNIDPMMLEKVISSGLTASDRYVKLVLGLVDRPGELASISKVLYEQNANVIEVLHTRHNKGLQVSQVELEIAIETRGTEHLNQVLAALAEEGYVPRLAADSLQLP